MTTTIDKYKLEVEVQGAEGVNKLNDGIKTLGQTIIGVGMAEFVHGILEMSKQITDLADATGLSTGYVKAFSESVTAAGGDGEKAATMLRKFTTTLEEVKNGSSKAEDAFKRIGISVNDLHTLGDKDLLGKAMAQLATMPAGFERTAAAVALFGKSVASLDPAKFEEIMKTKDPEALTKALEGTSEILHNLKANFETLQTAASGVFGPILKMFGDFKLSAQGATTIIEVLLALLTGAAAAKAVLWVQEIIKAYETWQKVTKGEVALQTALLALINPMALGVAILAGVAAYELLDSQIQKSIDKTRELNKETSNVGTPAEQVNQQYSATPFQGMSTPLATTLDSSKWLTASEQQSRIAKQQLDDLKNRNNIEQDYQTLLSTTIGLTKNEADYISGIAAINKTESQALLSNQDAYNTELAKGFNTNQDVLKSISSQKSEIMKNAEAEKTRFAINQQTTIELEKQKINYQALTEFNKSFTAQFNEVLTLSESNTLIGLIGDNLKEQTIELEKQQNIRTQLNSTIEKSSNLSKDAFKPYGDSTIGNAIRGIIGYYDVQRQASEQSNDQILQLRKDTADKIMLIDGSITNDQIRAILSEVDAVRSTEEVKYQIKKAAIEKEKALRNDNKAGMQQAFEDMARSIDPFVVAQKEVMSVFDNMNKAIDTFVQTGKFSFHDFALSVIRDMLAIELKAMATPLFTSIIKGVGAILGFASGGDPPVGKASIVGENGPEIFIPKSAGTIIPNSQLGHSGTGMNSGPVTNNYNTYNINALDSRSVAQVFAENRKSLLGSITMAQREMPYGMSTV